MAGEQQHGLSSDAPPRLPVLTAVNTGAWPRSCHTLLLAGALKLVAEAFPWRPGSAFAYTVDNHNSVLGMREEALAGGAAAAAVVPGATASGALLPPQTHLAAQMQPGTSSLRFLA